MANGKKNSNIQRNSFSKQAYDYILNRIFKGELTPGTRLKERELANELGISHIPIREALRKLEHEYWVKIVPYEGAFVRQLGPVEMEEIYQVRYALEGLAIQLAIGKMDQKSLNKLEQILKDEEEYLQLDMKTRDFSTFPDLQFHRLIIETAANDRLKHIISTFDVQSRSLTPILGDKLTQEQRRESHNEHIGLYKAIVAKDPETAEKLIKHHLTKAMVRNVNWLKEHGGDDQSEDMTGQKNGEDSHIVKELIER